MQNAADTLIKLCQSLGKVVAKSNWSCVVVRAKLCENIFSVPTVVMLQVCMFGVES